MTNYKFFTRIQTRSRVQAKLTTRPCRVEL